MESTENAMESSQERPEDKLQDSTAQSIPNPDRCKLLSLPSELRNRIYEYASTSARPGPVARVYIDARYGRFRFDKRLPKLLQTCRKVREEALVIFLKCNNFVFTMPGDFHVPVKCGWFGEHVMCMEHIELWAHCSLYKPCAVEVRRGLKGYTLHFSDPRKSLLLPRSTELLNGINIVASYNGKR